MSEEILQKTKIEDSVSTLKPDKVVFAWTCKDYEDFQRGKIWNISMIILVLILFAGGIFYDAWTFSLLIVVFAIVYYIVHKTESKELTISLSEVGIRISNTFFSYQKILGFSIVYNPPMTKKLIIFIKNDLIGERRLELPEEQIFQIQEFLKGKIPEIENKGFSVSDFLNKFLKL